jgi:hypothetical protein
MQPIDSSCLHYLKIEHKTENYFFFAVLADCLKAFAVGAPFAPALRIRSPDPAAMRFRFA